MPPGDDPARSLRWLLVGLGYIAEYAPSASSSPPHARTGLSPYFSEEDQSTYLEYRNPQVGDQLSGAGNVEHGINPPATRARPSHSPSTAALLSGERRTIPGEPLCDLGE